VGAGSVKPETALTPAVSEILKSCSSLSRTKVRSGSVVLRSEGNWKMLRPLEKASRAHFQLNRRVGRPQQIGKTLQQHAECNFALQACKGGSQAEMDTLPEAEMPVGCSSNIEMLRVGEHRVIVVG
jgi:hypothetical protein